MSFRKIHTEFWTDPYFEERTPEQRYFYLYLITNPKVNQLGIYEFSVKHAALEMGYSIDTIEQLLKYFELAGKIVRSTASKEICLVNFWKYNGSKSPKVGHHVKELANKLKDKSLLNDLIEYPYSIYTKSQEEEEKEEEQEEEKEQVEEGDNLNNLLEYCYKNWPNGKKKDPLALKRSFRMDELQWLNQNAEVILENLKEKINLKQIGPNQNLAFWLKQGDWQEAPKIRKSLKKITL